MINPVSSRGLDRQVASTSSPFAAPIRNGLVVLGDPTDRLNICVAVVDMTEALSQGPQNISAYPSMQNAFAVVYVSYHHESLSNDMNLVVVLQIQLFIRAISMRQQHYAKGWSKKQSPVQNLDSTLNSLSRQVVLVPCRVPASTIFEENDTCS